jgi:hypothetical protein
MTGDQLLQMRASGRIYQERYHNALSPWTERAPAPVLGQSIDDYRRDTLVKIKKLLPRGRKLRKVKVYATTRSNRNCSRRAAAKPTTPAWHRVRWAAF